MGAKAIFALVILRIHKHKDVNVGKVVTDLVNVKDRCLSRTLPVKNLITILLFFLSVQVGEFDWFQLAVGGIFPSCPQNQRYVQNAR